MKVLSYFLKQLFILSLKKAIIFMMASNSLFLTFQLSNNLLTIFRSYTQ